MIKKHFEAGSWAQWPEPSWRYSPFRANQTLHLGKILWVEHISAEQQGTALSKSGPDAYKAWSTALSTYHMKDSRGWSLIPGVQVLWQRGSLQAHLDLLLLKIHQSPGLWWFPLKIPLHNSCKDLLPDRGHVQEGCGAVNAWRQAKMGKWKNNLYFQQHGRWRGLEIVEENLEDWLSPHLRFSFSPGSMDRPCPSTEQKLGLPQYFRDWDKAKWELGP